MTTSSTGNLTPALTEPDVNLSGSSGSTVQPVDGRTLPVGKSDAGGANARPCGCPPLCPQSLVFPCRHLTSVLLQMPADGIQRRFVEALVVVITRVATGLNIGRGPPATCHCAGVISTPHGLGHLLGGLVADRRLKLIKNVPRGSSISGAGRYSPGSQTAPERTSFPVLILAVDDLRLCRMKGQFAPGELRSSSARPSGLGSLLQWQIISSANRSNGIYGSGSCIHRSKGIVEKR